MTAVQPSVNLFASTSFHKQTWCHFNWMRISVPQIKSTEREELDQLLRNVRCSVMQKWLWHEGSRHTPGICPLASDPARTQGVSSCPPSQMQHCFLCVFCTYGKWLISIYSTCWRKGPSSSWQVAGSFESIPPPKKKIIYFLQFAWTNSVSDY